MSLSSAEQRRQAPQAGSRWENLGRTHQAAAAPPRADAPVARENSRICPAWQHSTLSSQSDRLAGRLGGAWILDDLQMQLQPTGLGLEDLQKAGWQEAMPVFKELKLTAVQRLWALKVLGL